MNTPQVVPTSSPVGAEPTTDQAHDAALKMPQIYTKEELVVIQWHLDMYHDLPEVSSVRSAGRIIKQDEDPLIAIYRGLQERGIVKIGPASAGELGTAFITPEGEKEVITLYKGGQLVNKFLKIPPDWKTTAVLGLISDIEENKSCALLPVLGDALEDAGCRDPRILGHCRNEGDTHGPEWILNLFKRNPF